MVRPYLRLHGIACALLMAQAHSRVAFKRRQYCTPAQQAAAAAGALSLQHDPCLTP